MSQTEIVRRVLGGALRRIPTPFEVRLGVKALEQVEREQREQEIAAMAAYHGAEETK